jgi:hypothetical protein
MGSKLSEAISLNSALEVASLWMIENRGIGNAAARGFERRIPFSFLALQTAHSRLRLGSATARQSYHGIMWFRCNRG